MAQPGIVSKNLYELLGNDPEQDPDLRTPEQPTKAVTQPTARVGKRNGPAEAPPASTGAVRGGRGEQQRDRATGSERAFNDRNAGAAENRRRVPDDGLRQDRHPDRLRGGRDGRGDYRGGRGRGRSENHGARGLAPTSTRGSTRPDDRHSKTGLGDHDKQAAHGWGGNTGDAEWADEQAGEAIAKQEEKEGFDTTVAPPVDADGNPLPDTNGADAAASEEPEEAKTKGLDAYLAEQAEKKLALGGLDIRKPNEGSKQKFPEGKAFARNEEEENYFASTKENKIRERTKKEKQTLELDSIAMRPAEAGGDDRRGGRGGRGRGGPRRGDDGGERRERREPREPREPREGGEHRGRGGRGRGEGRGGRGGEFRGSRGGPRGGAAGPNIGDSNAFPSLGA